MWHSSHGIAAWRPVSGKFVRRCASASNLLRQDCSSWQAAQRGPDSPGGTSGWQAEQVVGTAVLKSMEAWQPEQLANECLPRSGKPVWSWSKLTRLQLSVEWQLAQAPPFRPWPGTNFAPCCTLPGAPAAATPPDQA